MPDQFADALERLDVQFSDFETMDGLIRRLQSVLADNQPFPSQLQIQIAIDKLGPLREQAAESGFTIDRFRRKGRTITQLRDARGRFVTAESRFIGTRGQIVTLGAGNISRIIEA